MTPRKVNTLDSQRMPKVSVVTCGFPCQDISNAGHQAGFEGLAANICNMSWHTACLAACIGISGADVAPAGSRSSLFFKAVQVTKAAGVHVLAAPRASISQAPDRRDAIESQPGCLRFGIHRGSGAFSGECLGHLQPPYAWHLLRCGEDAL